MLKYLETQTLQTNNLVIHELQETKQLFGEQDTDAREAPDHLLFPVYMQWQSANVEGYEEGDLPN